MFSFASIMCIFQWYVQNLKKKKKATSFMIPMGLHLSLTKLGIIKYSFIGIGQINNCFHLLVQQQTQKAKKSGSFNVEIALVGLY